MTAQTMRPRTAEFLLAEANGTLSREQVVFAATTDIIPAGTVVAQLSTTGNKWVPYDSEGDNAADVAKGILYAELPVSTGDQPATVLVRHCEVSGEHLTGLDADATTALAAAHVIVR